MDARLAGALEAHMDWKPVVIRNDGLKVETEDAWGKRMCLECGAVVEIEDNYCPNCGVRLLTPEQAETENPLLYMEYQKWEGDR